MDMLDPTKYAKQIAAARKYWRGVARSNGWYDEQVKASGGFFVHVWVDSSGNMIDSIYQPEGVGQDTVQVGR